MKAVIFDLDGTLVESLSGLTQALNLTLNEKGEPSLPPETVRGYIGDGMRMLIRRAFCEKKYPESSLAELEGFFRAHYAAVWEAGTVPYDGVIQMLESLQSKGVQLGVLSNKPHAFTVEIVEALFGRNLLPLIYGQREDVPKKPAPSALLAICEETGLSPQEVFYVGDSTVDLQTAQGAQTQGIGVTWGYHDKERLEGFGFALCHSMKELHEALLSA